MFEKKEEKGESQQPLSGHCLLICLRNVEQRYWKSSSLPNWITTKLANAELTNIINNENERKGHNPDDLSCQYIIAALKNIYNPINTYFPKWMTHIISVKWLKGIKYLPSKTRIGSGSNLSKIKESLELSSKYLLPEIQETLRKCKHN